MSNAKCIEMVSVGTSSVLQESTFDLHAPAKGEVSIRHTFIGVNFVDIYFRTGVYPVTHLPCVLGVEAAGVIEAIGDGVKGFSTGQRIVYAGLPLGSYTSHRNVMADRLIRIPNDVSDEMAAAALLRGMTAFMLLKKVREVKQGETILMHAAAGGLGQIIGQWASLLGAKLIGTVSNDAKKIAAQKSGYNELILYKHQDVVSEVKQLTQGQGADYVIDGIGATLAQSLRCVAPFGTVANIGQAGGPPPLINLSDLPKSVSYTAPSILQFISNKELYHEAGEAVMSLISKGHLKISLDHIMPLAKASEAHKRLETGQSTGVLLLKV